MAKRVSPMAGTPPTKRTKENEGAGAGAGNAANNGGKQEIDPNEFGDVLNAAGVDLREEESLLNSGLSEQGGLAGARLLHAPREGEAMLLDHDKLQLQMMRVASEWGLKLGSEENSSPSGLSQDVLGLVCASCEEWLATILSEAAAFSRHRRLAPNAGTAGDQSAVSKALKQIANQQKQRATQHEAHKVRLGLTDAAPADDKGSEESIQRAANDTARMMTSNIGRKRKFSWMTAGASAGGDRGAGRRQNTETKFKVREDGGIVLRDILPALERKNMGVKRALVRGYAKLRN